MKSTVGCSVWLVPLLALIACSDNHVPQVWPDSGIRYDLGRYDFRTNYDGPLPQDLGIGPNTWVERFLSGGVVVPESVSVTPAGEIYISGLFNKTVTLDKELTARGAQDGFVAKLNANRQVVWSIHLEAPTGKSVQRLLVRSDSQGDARIAGWYRGKLATFKGTPLNGGNEDGNAFFARVANSGTVAYTKVLLTAKETTIEGLDVDKNSGDIVVSGGFLGRLQIETAFVDAKKSSSDAYVALFNSAGALSWLVRGGSDAADSAFEVVFAKSGRLLVAGRVAGRADFGSYNVDPSSSVGLFFASIRALDGRFEWAWHARVTTGSVQQIASDSQGNLVAVGLFADGPLEAGTTLVNGKTTSDDVFALRLTATGGLDWVKAYGGDAADSGTALVVDTNDRVFVAGALRGPADFAGITLKPSGSVAGFVARISISDGTAQNAVLADSSDFAAISDLVSVSNGFLLAFGGFKTQLTVDGQVLNSSTDAVLPYLWRRSLP